MILLLSLALAQEAYVPKELEGVSCAQQVMDRAVGALKLLGHPVGFVDYKLRIAMIPAIEDYLDLRKARARVKKYPNPIGDAEKWVEDRAKEPLRLNWRQGRFHVPEPYGLEEPEKTVLANPLDLRHHLMLHLPPHLQDIATQAFDKMYDVRAVEAWAKEVRHQMDQRLIDTGFRDRYLLTLPSIREAALDQVMGESSKAKGFRTDRKGRPLVHKHFSQPSFYLRLGMGDFVVDGRGDEITGGGERAVRHTKRGHAIAMAYLAHEVPGFVDLIKHLGRTMDREAIWYMLFDNAESTGTVHFSGYWTSKLRDYWGIRS